MKDNAQMSLKLFILFFIFEMFLFADFKAKIINKKTMQPLSDAFVSDSKHSVKSDKNGLFVIDTSEDKLHIKAYGFRRKSIDVDSNVKIIYVEPIRVKALYLTFWGASMRSKTLKKVVDIIDETQVNAVVVDVKNEYGSTVYKTSVKQANSYGAHKKRTNRCIDKFINLMKEKNIYTIARIVTFKDELQASNNEDYAIKKQNGEIWRNHDDMGWVDPFDKRSHSYTLAIAEDAAKVGFDEINFDYIRFPAKKGLLLKMKNTQQNRISAIEEFLKNAQNRLRKYGVFISVDTYGNVCWERGDTGIGQSIESLAKYSDYICPMLYPSGFAKGSFYFKHPSKHPYDVVFRSIKNILNRVDSNRIRPWLQYFKDYAHSKHHYKRFEIQEQIRAADELNTNGWMFWSPSSKYQKSYLVQEQE